MAMMAADYNEVMGYKYKGRWVKDLTIKELKQIPKSEVKSLKLTKDQKNNLYLIDYMKKKKNVKD